MSILTTLYKFVGLLCLPLVIALLLLLLGIFLRKRGSGKILLIMCLVWLYLSGTGVFAKWLVTPLEQPVKIVDRHQILRHRAIVVLGAGEVKSPFVTQMGTLGFARVLEALRIYRIAKLYNVDYTIFLCGGDTNHSGYTEAELFKQKLIELGVPKRLIVTENRSKNTFENAKFVKKLLKQRHFSEVLLVTGALHMKRAQQYFDYFDIDTIAAPSDFLYPSNTLLPIGYNIAIQDFAMHEYMGMGLFHLYNKLGLNAVD